MNYIFEGINLMCSLLLLPTKHWKLQIEKEQKTWKERKKKCGGIRRESEQNQ